MKTEKKKTSKNAKDRDRSNVDGRFVSEEEGDANPQGTTSERVKKRERVKVEVEVPTE